MTFQKGAPGRLPGTLNKNTAEIRALAGQAAPKMIAELKRLATKSKNEMVRVAAAKELLDRAIGKATQPIEANVNILDRMTDGEQSALLAALDVIAADEERASEASARQLN